MTLSDYHDERGAQCVSIEATTPTATTAHPLGLNERLARFFRARPGQWLDGRALAQVAGAYGWRTRISDLRRAPFSMTIENKQTRGVSARGKRFTVSEYRYVPNSAGGAR